MQIVICSVSFHRATPGLSQYIALLRLISVRGFLRVRAIGHDVTAGGALHEELHEPGGALSSPETGRVGSLLFS